MTNPPSSDRRGQGPESVAAAISGYVTELVRVPSDGLSVWMPGLGVAAGWQVGRAENSTVQPTRIAVYGHDPIAGWDACETIDLFTFTGSPPVEVMRLNADCGLRALGAEEIAVRKLHTPPSAPVTAMQSNGHFNLTGRQRIWAQCTIYIASDGTRGLLVEHSVYVRMERLPTLIDDIAQLSDALHNVFNQGVSMPNPSLERRDGAG